MVGARHALRRQRAPARARPSPASCAPRPRAISIGAGELRRRARRRGRATFASVTTKRRDAGAAASGAPSSAGADADRVVAGGARRPEQPQSLGRQLAQRDERRQRARARCRMPERGSDGVGEPRRRAARARRSSASNASRSRASGRAAAGHARPGGLRRRPRPDDGVRARAPRGPRSEPSAPPPSATTPPAARSSASSDDLAPRARGTPPRPRGPEAPAIGSPSAAVDQLVGVAQRDAEPARGARRRASSCRLP